LASSTKAEKVGEVICSAGASEVWAEADDVATLASVVDTGTNGKVIALLICITLTPAIGEEGRFLSAFWEELI
jgi:hypothetical protein